MFGIDSSELLIIAVLTIVVVGPKELPRVLYKIGQVMGKIRGFTQHFRTGLDAMVREVELEELEKKWAADNKRIMAENPDVYDAASMVAGDTPDEDTPTGPSPDEPPIQKFETPDYVVDVETLDEELKAAASGSCGMKDIDESKAPLLEHLVELRKRLLLCIVALGVGFAVCFYFAEPIFTFLIQPYLDAGGDKLVFTKMYGQFLVQVKIGLFGAFLICFPIIAMQLWAFVAPGLYTKEKRALLPFLAVTPLLFFMGAALAYFIVMPTAFHFFLSYEGKFGGIDVTALPDTDNYLTMVMRFVLAFGISFLLPVLLMLLNRAGIVTRGQLVSARRYAWVGAFVIAAVATPPDATSMLLLAIPLVLLFEVTLIAIWFTDKRKSKAETEDESDEKEVSAAE